LFSHVIHAICNRKHFLVWSEVGFDQLNSLHYCRNEKISDYAYICQGLKVVESLTTHIIMISGEYLSGTVYPTTGAWF